MLQFYKILNSDIKNTVGFYSLNSRAIDIISRNFGFTLTTPF